MAENEKAAYHDEFKDWYLFAGLLPIHRHDLAEMIKDKKLVEVRVRTEDRISNGLITVITDMLFPLFPQTIVIEGNSAEQVFKAHPPVGKTAGK